MNIKVLDFDECEYCRSFEPYAINKVKDSKNWVELGCCRYGVCQNVKKAQKQKAAEKAEKEGC